MLKAVVIGVCLAGIVTGSVSGGEPLPAGTVRAFNAQLGLKMVWCPAGTFLMGNSDPGQPAAENERPQHRVRLTRGFWLGQTEVTQGQWQSVMGTTPWVGMEGIKEGADTPATYVSWDDAEEFCKRLTERERQAGRLAPDQHYRLPTEAEWEYTCRAGTTTKFSFGDDAAQLGDYAWWSGIAGGVVSAKTEGYAHQVGTKLPNPWGLSDMHGNVWEWCADVYDGNYYSQSPTDDPQGPSTGSSRAVRSGCWGFAAWGCQSSFRAGYGPTGRFLSLGFRVAVGTTG